MNNVPLPPLTDLVDKFFNLGRWLERRRPNRSETIGRILGAINAALTIRVEVMGPNMAADQRVIWKREAMECFAELCVRSNIGAMGPDPFDEIQAEEIAQQCVDEFFEGVITYLTPY